MLGAVRPQNMVACRFYERHGMKIEGTVAWAGGLIPIDRRVRHDFRSDRLLLKGTLGVHKETIASSPFAKARLALQKPKALWMGAAQFSSSPNIR
jgi:hypothetical protein